MGGACGRVNRELLRRAQAATEEWPNVRPNVRLDKR
eukprot:gene25216-66900_t